MKLFNIFHKCHNSIFILHCFIATSKESAPDIMHSNKKKKQISEGKTQLNPDYVNSAEIFMYCSLSRSEVVVVDVPKYIVHIEVPKTVIPPFIQLHKKF